MRKRVVITVTTGAGHFQRLRPLISALAARGAEPWVFTDAAFAAEVAADGGRHVDLFAGRPLAAADSESPRPSRQVSFAGHFGEAVARDVARVDPSVMISDSFAVVGQVAARILKVPHVVFRSGHDVDPTRSPEELGYRGGLTVSPRCTEAVDILRERYGFADASPFMFFTTKSELLNVFGEPELFISAATRAALEPVAFFGSLPAPDLVAKRIGAPTTRWFAPRGTRVYVATGTIAPGFMLERLKAILTQLADALAQRPDVTGLLSVGDPGASRDTIAMLSRPNLRCEPFLNQWQALDQAEVFITHQGMNSTHEAIFQRAPMISMPLFADQFPMAALCRRLGVSAATLDAARPIEAGEVHAALDAAIAGQAAALAALEHLRDLELETIARRPEVVDRILAFA